VCRYCTDGSDSDGATLAFGSTGGDDGNSAVRALVDPDDALQGTFSFDSYSSCCSSSKPYDICSAPYDNNGITTYGGVSVNDATDLCYALGYAVGTLVAYSTSNGCPEVGERRA
jgi:hypothetical protein